MLTLNHLVTSGTFSLDGCTWTWTTTSGCSATTPNAWLSTPRTTRTRSWPLSQRWVIANLRTHAHYDHIDAAAALAEVTARRSAHPADREPGSDLPRPGPDRDLADGQTIAIAGAELTVLHTPGHSRGAVCFDLPDQGRLFSGDTLFAGRGATVVPFPTSARSSARSAIGRWSLMRTRSSTPATGRTPPSVPSGPTWGMDRRGH